MTALLPEEPVWPWLGAETPRYDTDLTSMGVLELTGRERKARIARSLSRKCFLAACGVHMLAGRGRARLRSLAVPALGLWSWRDERVERREGPHAEALAYLDALALKLSGGPTAGAELAELRADNARMDREIQSLTLQVARLSAELTRRGPSLEEARR